MSPRHSEPQRPARQQLTRVASALACLVLIGACDAPTSSPQTTTLQQALVEEPIADLLGARGLARLLAGACDGVDLAPGIGDWGEADAITALRDTRRAEYEAITSGAVIRSGRIISDAFDARYGFPHNLLTTRPKDVTRAQCAAGWREADQTTLIGLMLTRG